MAVGVHFWGEQVMALRLSELIKLEWIFPCLTASTKEDVLNEIAQRLSAAGTNIDAAELLHKLLEREGKASTGADQGLAIPHAIVPGTRELVVSVARTTRGIDFGALDNERSSLFFTIVSPPGEPTYLQAISAVCKLMRSPSARRRVMQAKDANEIFSALLAEEAVRDGKSLPVTA